MAAAESFGPDLEEPKKLCFFYSRLQHRTTKAGASNSGTPPPSPSPACQRIATTAWRRRPRELKLRSCAVLRRRVRRGVRRLHRAPHFFVYLMQWKTNQVQAGGKMALKTLFLKRERGDTFLLLDSRNIQFLWREI